MQSVEDNRARNYVLDYTAPMPSDRLSEDQRRTMWHVQSVHSALLPVDLRIGVSVQPRLLVQLLQFVYREGQRSPNLSAFRPKEASGGMLEPAICAGLRLMLGPALATLVRRIDHALAIHRDTWFGAMELKQ